MRNVLDADGSRATASFFEMAPPASKRIPNKLAALDSLDRLAMNTSGWYTDKTLDQLTDARKAIITDRFGDALVILEDVRVALDLFVRSLKDQSSHPNVDIQKATIDAAHGELEQLASVLSWLDQRPQYGSER